MSGAITEVDYLFRMTQCETGAAAFMSGVCHTGSKTPKQRGAESICN